MAWNEPGGSGKKDPWGGGKGNSNDGPPDLDEVVKKMQQKFTSVFGGGSGGQSSSGGGGVGSVGIGLIVIIAAIAWALSGIYIVKEGTRGVVLMFGAYNKTTLPGPQWFPRFVQSVDIVNIEEIRTAAIGYRDSSNSRSSTRVDRESLMLTQDENIVEVQLAVQYKVKSASDYLFRVKNPDVTLRHATESAAREIIGKSKMDFILTEGRAEISSQALDLIQRILDKYETGLLVISVNLQDAQPPEQVQGAFEDAVKAREDNERVKNEAQAYANDILPRANGKAARMVAEANAYKEQVIAEAEGETDRFKKILVEYVKAPKVTRKRLYLDSMESVMKNTTKVMVDVSGNNLLYLPLDKAGNSSDRRRIVPPPPEILSSSNNRSSTSTRSSRDNVRRGSR